MEENEACAILRIPIEASRSEVETAFQKRMREVRARSAAARSIDVRAQCQREVAAIREAQDRLLRALAESPRSQPTNDGLPVDHPRVDEPPVNQRPAGERLSEASGAAEPPAAPVEEDTRRSPWPTVSIPDQLSPGQFFLSRFELRCELEIGNIGAVWLAQDHASRHQVALIFLPDSINGNKAAIQDLRNEIRRYVALNHSNILHIFDLVEDKGKVAIEVEYQIGRSFSELRLSRPNQVLEVGDLKKWVKELCGALQYAHEEAGLIHGNIHPGNLIVDRAGSLKVKDFGISNCINESINRLIGTGEISEALQYKSPQHAFGEKASIAHDLYSLGATLYESLTSQPPFYGRDFALDARATKPPSMSERRAELRIEGENIPRNWEETVAACLAKDPNQRPKSAIEVARRLEKSIPPPEIATSSPPPPPPPPTPTPTPPPTPEFGVLSSSKRAASVPLLAPRKPWLVILGVIFFLAILSVITLLAFHYLRPIKETSPASTFLPNPSGSTGKEPSPPAATPSAEMSATSPPGVSTTHSPEVRTTSSPQETATPTQSQSASPSPTLSQREIDATKEDVIQRINALPGLSTAAKARLIEKLDRASSMERLIVVPFEVGQTVLHRVAADELVQTFASPKIRDKLSDPTIILVVAGYADTGGRADLNLRVSQLRAEHVGRILKEGAKLLNVIQTVGMGGTELLDSKRPDQNRAVEIWAFAPL